MPTKPKAYARNGVTVDDLIDFTPALREQGAAGHGTITSSGPSLRRPSSNSTSQLGTITLGTSFGATNWPGGSYDPETHIFYVQACNSCMRIIEPCSKRKPEATDMDYVEGHGGREDVDVQGMPIIKPPYGTITAINLDTGEFVWQVAHGETPDLVRNSPVLNGTGDTAHRAGGSRGYARHEDSRDLRRSRLSPQSLRAGAARCFAPTTKQRQGSRARCICRRRRVGSPMTYMLNGKQYIVVAVGGGTLFGRIYRVSFAEELKSEQISRCGDAHREFPRETCMVTRREVLTMAGAAPALLAASGASGSQTAGAGRAGTARVFASDFFL